MQTQNSIMEVEAKAAGQVTTLPVLAPSGRQRFAFVRRLLRNPKALIGVCIVLFFVLVAVFAPIIAPGDPTRLFVARPHQAPSATNILGTEGQGRDVLMMTVWGARVSLTVGFGVGLLTTLIGIVIGMSAGYFRGKVDDVLSLLMNLFLVIPGLPLLILIATYLQSGILTIILALSFTGWAWPARIMRSQALSLREKDFVSAAIVTGESSPHIIFREVLPNMASIIVGSMFGSVTYAIGAEAALSFLGLTNVSDVSWGTNLYWAQNDSALLTGEWWTFIPSGMCIALVAFGLTMVNYGMDEITNPRLRAERDLNNVLKGRILRKLRNVRATPVVRRAH